MYGRHYVAAPPEGSSLRKNNTWRKEGRAQRPSRTLIFSRFSRKREVILLRFLKSVELNIGSQNRCGFHAIWFRSFLRVLYTCQEIKMKDVRR